MQQLIIQILRAIYYRRYEIPSDPRRQLISQSPHWHIDRLSLLSGGGIPVHEYDTVAALHRGQCISDENTDPDRLPNMSCCLRCSNKFMHHHSHINVHAYQLQEQFHPQRRFVAQTLHLPNISNTRKDKVPINNTCIITIILTLLLSSEALSRSHS